MVVHLYFYSFYTLTFNFCVGPRKSSAFCSDMLDEYLEKEAEQISNRVAVFSTGSTLPVSYQLPAKSSSYIVTLDSRLKTQSASTNVCSNPSNKLLANPASEGSLKSTSPGPQLGLRGNKWNRIHKYEAQKHHSSRKHRLNKERSKSSSKVSSHNSSLWFSITSAKMYSQILIKEMEEDALSKGKGPTQIITKRAKFALNALFSYPV